MTWPGRIPVSLLAARARTLGGAWLLAAVTVGCGSPVHPSHSAVAPAPVAPSNGAVLSYYSQPILLRVTNGLRLNVDAVTLVLEVAEDADFTRKVSTTSVTQSRGSETALPVDHLEAGREYFWRVGVDNDDARSILWSTARSFRVAPVGALLPPIPVPPSSDAPLPRRPTLVVQNAVGTDVSHVTYRFEVARDRQFTQPAAEAEASEAAGVTSVTLPTALDAGQVFFWRARAFDRDRGIVSDWSAPQRLPVRLLDDGKHRYRFSVQRPVVDSGMCAHSEATVFDDALVVSGNSLRFSPWSCGWSLGRLGPPFVVELTDNGGTLGGLIGGRGIPDCRSPWPFFLQIGPSPRAYHPEDPGVYATTATSEPDGTIRGTFDGYVTDYVGSLGNYAICGSPRVHWTLSPWRP